MLLPDFLKEPILALSWKAPYAQLMLRGKIETRTWPTKYRGWVLICCSKTPYKTQSLIDIAGMDQFNRINKIHPSVLNYQSDLGMAIAIGKLTDCRPMTKQDEDACFVEYKEKWIETKKLATGTKKEKLKQLWCHVYEELTPLFHPFEFKGGQGWKQLSQTDKHKVGINFYVSKSREDYQLFLEEFHFTENDVQKIVQNNDDITIMPRHFSDNFNIAASKVNGAGFFAAKSFQYGEVIAAARIEGKRTPAGRYINHSPFPNANFIKWPTDSISKDADLMVVARKEIKPGEEIFINYRHAATVNGYF
jgi:hypothetical protein